MKKIIVFSLMLLLACFSSLSWGAIHDTGTNTTLGQHTGDTMGTTTLQNGLECNTFVGFSAGQANTVGIGGNSFIGGSAGKVNTSGIDNSFFGFFAGQQNTDGSLNTSFGVSAGFANTVAAENVHLGAHSGAASMGSRNTFAGRAAGYSSGPLATNTGSSNTFLGFDAGYANADGSNNVFLGSKAGYSNISGGSNVFVGASAGYSVGASDFTMSNLLYIDNCYSGGLCIEPLIAGSFELRLLQIDGSLTAVSLATPSDLRYKKDIRPLESSLDKVLQLRGVTYVWDQEKVPGSGYKSGRQIGLIAQEVEKVLPELVHTDTRGYKTLSYDKLAPVLVEAIKEQQQEMLERESERIAYMAALQANASRALAKGGQELDSLKKAAQNMLGRLARVERSGGTIAAK